MGKRSERFAITAVIAAAAGYVAGILTAPKSGKETRDEIKDVTTKQIREFEAQLKAKHTELSNLIDETKQKLLRATDDRKKDIEDATEKATHAKDKVRLALSDIRDGEVNDKDLQNAIKDAEKAISHLKKFLIK